MFKSGDRVKCIIDKDCLYLKKNKKYTIIRIRESVLRGPDIYLVELEQVGGWFNEYRFILDISEIRKQKLIKICLNQETK